MCSSALHIDACGSVTQGIPHSDDACDSPFYAHEAAAMGLA